MPPIVRPTTASQPARQATPIAARHALPMALLLAAGLWASPLAAQVDVTATAGTPAASYTTLKGSFDAINAGTHQGVITIGISGNTTETATAVINASGAGAAIYTSIAISPTGGAARSISGAIAAGSPLIDFNGADNVTIDGLNTGGNSLIIANTTASATSGTGTMRFIGGATSNTITNANIQGSSSSSVATNGGTIFFSTDAVTANGNDNNTISNNSIGPAGVNLPSRAILCNGSTATTAIGNSGNVVTNNDIFDFFAPTVTSAGVATNGGCNTWTITNNRFFQTATRTWTTGAAHTPIILGGTTATSGAQGFTVTGNTIGYASNTQTGIYTLTGSTGIFRGIVFNGITGATVSNLDNNTIAAVSLTGVTSSGTAANSPFVAISIPNGLVTTNGNTIGSQSATGNLTYSTTTTTATDVFGINSFASDNWTSSSNVIGGITGNNAGATGAFRVIGLRADTLSTATWTAASNVIGGTVANSIQNNSISPTAQVIGIAGNGSTSPISTVTANTVRNLTAAGGTGTAATASVIGYVSTNATPSHTIAQNTISGLTNTHATAATVVTGIQFTGGTANTVARNRIYGLSSATNSTAAEINGIRVTGGTTTYRNNMIAVGAGIANAIGTGSTTGGVNGILEAGGTNNFFHNSVYVGGAPTAGLGPSYAFASTQVTVTRSYRDNIFFNARSNAGATGKNYALRVAGTTANPAGLTINNNIYFANGTGAVFGFFNSLDVANLGAWRTAVGQDFGSFEVDPQYVDPANAVPDLHLHPTTATAAESNGVDVGVTDDYDGQTRAGLTPTDIGADAGNFNGVDLSPPAIAYTPFGNTSLTTNRTLTATLTDVTGVATGGLAPRIYYRKNAGAYFSQACGLTGGTVNNGTWDCTINYADLGGAALTDVIGYFVVAQDTVGNLGSNPGGAIGTSVNTITTPPTPNTYTIVTAYSGPIGVGSGESITSLTNAGGLFELLNAGALTGDLVINLTSDLTGELGTHALNQWAEDGAGGYTLLIRPSGAPRTITGSNTGALIRFNGTDRLRLDGSTAATFAAPEDPLAGGNAALRELTIRNANVGTSAVVIALQSGATGAQNNTFRNLHILGQDPTTTLAGIAMGGASPGTGGIDNDGNRIENCTVRRAIYGIYSSGQNAANPNQGTVIAHNDLTATGTDRIRRVGIAIFNDNGLQVIENAVGGIDTTEGADAVAIGVGAQGVDATVVASGGITNALVARNRVSGVFAASATGFSAVGIAISGAPGGANVVVNNMISGVISPATAPDLVAGIFVVGVPGSSTRVLYNSVWMSGDRGAVATQSPSFALAISGSDPTVELKDNALTTTQTSSGGGAGADSYAIGVMSTTFANLDSNYNDFFASGANATHFRSGSLGVSLGTEYATVAAWSAAVADDANSLQVDPLFVATTDLHLQPTSPLVGAGTPVAGVTDDYDGEPRSATLPTIGADERGADLAITKTDGVTSVTPGGSTTYTITASNAGPSNTTATVADTFPAVLSCTWTCIGAGGGICTAAGVGDINDAVTLPAGGSVTYTASCAISAAATGSLANTATVTGVAGDTNGANNSATDTDTVTASADLAITKTDGVTTATPGGSVTYTITASNAGPSNTTATVADTFPASLTCTWTCVGAGGGTCTAAGSGNINDAVNLPAGGSVTYTASCAISASATGSLANTATVTGAASDPNGGNNSALDTDTLTPSANLGITKTDGVTSVAAGGSTVYTIAASNAGPSNTTATVADTFPATLTCNWTCAGAGGGTCAAAGAGNINDAVNLPVGGSVTYTASCSVSGAATGSIVNNATVTGAASDPNGADNTATDTDTVTASADVRVGMTVDNATPALGNNVIFTITANNAGPANATGVQLDALLPVGLAHFANVPSSGTYTPATGLWNIGNLANGATATLTLTATVNRTQSLVFQASKAGQGQTDPNASNNTATSRLNGAALVDIQVSATVDDDTPAVSQNVNFLVTARNAGPATATLVSLTANLPAGLTPVSDVPSQGTYSSGTGIWDVGTLNAGASATLTVQMTNTVATPVTRTVTRTFTNEDDLVLGNDAASVTLNPSGALADLALSKIATQDPVASGLNFGYYVVIANLGTADATGVSVTDTLPAGLTLVSAAASQGSCAGTTTITCTIGNVLAGGGAVIDLVVTKTVGGNVTNSASVAGAQTDPNAANNTNGDQTTPVELQSFNVD
jgi:uncharacterized repeat protein (TIGR01451 family)